MFIPQIWWGVVALAVLAIVLLLTSEMNWRSKLPNKVRLDDKSWNAVRASQLAKGIYLCAECRNEFAPDTGEDEYCQFCRPREVDLYPAYRSETIEHAIKERVVSGVGYAPLHTRLGFEDFGKEEGESDE